MIQPNIIYEQPKSILKKPIKPNDPNDPFSNQCLCEKCFTKPCKPEDLKKENCYTNLCEWCDFYVYCNGNTREDSLCYCIMCFPIIFPIKVIFCLPCACYNQCRNCCNNTDKKNYLC